MQQFKTGDVVRIAFNRVLMTVEEVRDDGVVMCIWFDTNDQLRRDGFLPESLRQG